MGAIRQVAANPHDAYAKGAFREVPQARGFFRSYLPRDVVSLLDWRTLRLEPESYISDSLQCDFSDLRFTIRLLGDHRPRRITLLFEHKDRPRYRTPRQLLRYICRQIEETSDQQPLPCILTVVLLQRGTWNRLRTLSAEYELPETARAVFAPYVLDFQMVMVELASLGEEELKGTNEGRLALALLKAVGENQPLGWLHYRGILRDICQHVSASRRRRILRRGLVYLTSVVEPEQESEVRQALHDVQEEFRPVRETMMTLLQHLEERGKEQGLREGLSKGKRQGLREGSIRVLLRLLPKLYPQFSVKHRRLVSKLSDARLQDIADAIAMQRTWEEVESLLQAE